MLLWVVLALLSAAVVAALVHPLLARRDGAGGGTGDEGATAVYRDQLAEIEAEAERGLIGRDEAENARREIARRLLATASGPAGEARGGRGAPAAIPSAPARTGVPVRLVAAALALALPVAALTIYLRTGAPSLRDQPLASRRATPPADGEMARLIGAVEARLKAQPEDGRGWDVIAPVYMRLARYGDAVHAFRNSIRLLGETPRRLAGLSEALMMLEQGQLGQEARAALTRLIELEPGHLQARFWLAFAKEQDGANGEAASDYARLLQDAPADAPWRPMLEERLGAARKAAGNAPPPSATASAPPPLSLIAPGSGAAIAPGAGAATAPTGAGGMTAPGAGAAAGARGPSAADVAAAERLTPEERQAMIVGMVDGLAARLEADGRDLAGWQRLIRALIVLGRKDDAEAALEKARRSLAGEPTALAELADLAKALGLGT